MEEIEHILRNFGLILGAGLVSQLIATVTRLPQMVVLVAAGALIGPSVLGLVSNPLSGLGAQLLFNIGVALILFHGGTGISLRVISGTAVGLGLLVLPGVLLTALIVALAVSPCSASLSLLPCSWERSWPRRIPPSSSPCSTA